MLLVKRANETAKTVLPEASILGMIYDAISKDPREVFIHWTIIGGIYYHSSQIYTYWTIQSQTCKNE